MNVLAKQLSEKVGIDEDTAMKVADYIAQNLDEVTAAAKAPEPDPPMEDTEGTGPMKLDDPWVLRQSDSC